ncbi:Uncharacterized protein SCF082_LOCUS3308 [Durusdinium trenchii]|uniref:Uncharacterized protein n=1 Tax=Durusdinium trenchii TaxID=1381693 RepID=A0ABP0HS02_9DINO
MFCWSGADADVQPCATLLLLEADEGASAAADDGDEDDEEDEDVDLRRRRQQQQQQQQQAWAGAKADETEPRVIMFREPLTRSNSNAGLRFTALSSLVRFVLASCGGLDAGNKSTSDVDVFVDVHKLLTPQQRLLQPKQQQKLAFELVGLREHAEALESELVHLDGDTVLHPVLDDECFKTILATWCDRHAARRHEKLNRAVGQVEHLLQGRGVLVHSALFLSAMNNEESELPAAMSDDVTLQHAQALHELWELALDKDNHAAISDLALQTAMDFLERAERDSPLRELASGVMFALVASSNGGVMFERLTQLNLLRKALDCVRLHIPNMLHTPPPRTALLLLRLAAHFADKVTARKLLLKEIGYLTACMQSGASTAVSRACVSLYARIFRFDVLRGNAHPCSLSILGRLIVQQHNASKKKSNSNGRSRNRSAPSRDVIPMTQVPGLDDINMTALQDFLREAALHSAGPSSDIAHKLSTCILFQNVSFAAELESQCDKCAGKVLQGGMMDHARRISCVGDRALRSHGFDLTQTPCLHALREVLLCCKVVCTSISDLVRWALFIVAQSCERNVANEPSTRRRLRAMIGRTPMQLDSSASKSMKFRSGDTTFLELSTSTDLPESINQVKVPDDAPSWADAEQNGQALSRSRHSIIAQVARVGVVVLHQWARALAQQCTLEKFTFARFRSSGNAVLDSELEAVFGVLCHSLGFANERWHELFLREENCIRASKDSVESALVSLDALDQLLSVPQIGLQMIRRFGGRKVSAPGTTRRAKTQPACSAARTDADVKVQHPSQLKYLLDRKTSHCDIDTRRITAIAKPSPARGDWNTAPLTCVLEFQLARTSTTEVLHASALVRLLTCGPKGFQFIDSELGLDGILRFWTFRPLRFRRSDRVHHLLAAAILLLSYGPVALDCHCDLADLKRPVTEDAQLDELSQAASGLQYSAHAVQALSGEILRFSSRAGESATSERALAALVMSLWCLGRRKDCCEILRRDRHTVGMLSRILGHFVRRIVPTTASDALSESAMDVIEASLCALWILVAHARASCLADLLMDLKMSRCMGAVCTIANTLRTSLSTHKVPSSASSWNTKTSQPQRLVFQALSLLWAILCACDDMILAMFEPCNRWMLQGLRDCCYDDRKMCSEVRQRACILLSYLTQKAELLSQARKESSMQHLIRDALGEDAILNLSLHLLDGQDPNLRSVGAKLMAQSPLVERQHKLIKRKSKILRLLDLATEQSASERKCAILALLRCAESGMCQEEIVKHGLYRLLISAWISADRGHVVQQFLLSSLLSLVSQNSNNRTRIYQAEMRAKEIAGWAFFASGQSETGEQSQQLLSSSFKEREERPRAPKDVHQEFLAWNDQLAKELGDPGDTKAMEQQRSQREDMRKAMQLFDLIEPTDSQFEEESLYTRVKAPQQSPLWSFRTLILPTSSPATDEADEAQATGQTGVRNERDDTLAVVTGDVKQGSETDLRKQLEQARFNALSKTFKTGSPERPRGVDAGSSNAKGKSPRAGAHQLVVSSFSGAEKKEQVETVADNSLQAQTWRANLHFEQRMRSPTKSLWEAYRLQSSRWHPKVRKATKNTVTVEGAHSFVFPGLGPDAAAVAASLAKESPAAFLDRVSGMHREKKRQSFGYEPKRSMARFGHVQGSRVHDDLPLYDAPLGRKGFLYYDGEMDLISRFMGMDEFSPLQPPVSLFALGRADSRDMVMDITRAKALSTRGSISARQNGGVELEDGAKQRPAFSDPDNLLELGQALPYRSVLEALPGLCTLLAEALESGNKKPRKEVLRAIKPSLQEVLPAAERPAVYSMNHENGARGLPNPIGQTYPELIETEAGQSETSMLWTERGRVVDESLIFVLRAPGRIRTLLGRMMERRVDDGDGGGPCTTAGKRSPAFFDENPVARACAEMDWAYNLKQKGFRDFLDRFESSDVAEARELLCMTGPLLTSIFRFYCALSPQNPFAMLPKSFVRLLHDIEIIDKTEGTFKQSCNNLFIKVASMVPENLTPHMRRLNEQCDPLGVKRSRRLMRHDFMHVLLRIAELRYLEEAGTLSGALEQFLQVNVIRNLGPETILDFDSWRINRLYTSEVSELFIEHQDMLYNWFNELAGQTRRYRRWGAQDKRRLAIQEWNNGLRNLGMFTANFTIRESTFAFVLSTTNVVDWIKDWEPMVSLTYQDFLEALGRVTELVIIPTPEQLETFGVRNVIEFYTLMERTNLWTALDHSETDSQTRLSIWTRSKEDEGLPDERPLAERLSGFLELLKSRHKINEQREVEMHFWNAKRHTVSKKGSLVSSRRASNSGPDAAGDAASVRSERSRRSSLTEHSDMLSALQDDKELQDALQADPGHSETSDVEAELETFEVSTAAELHEMWRAKRTRYPDGTFEPRIKVINGVEFDIANLRFQDLPDYFKLENLLASNAACESIRRCYNLTVAESSATKVEAFKRQLESPAFLEKASAEQHDNWVRRNRKCDWVSAEQLRNYEDLEDTEKDKDRDIVRAAIKVYLANNI